MTLLFALQPLHFERITHPRVQSTAAHAKTRKRRAQQMTTIREKVSGGSESSQVQMAVELQHISKEERNKILKDAGLSLPEEPSTGQVLAMKSDLGIPWCKLRVLRRQVLETYCFEHSM